MLDAQVKQQVIDLADLIEESDYITFFGGAGVSTASGVPDFRGAKGIYTQGLAAEEILTPYYMNHHSEEYYAFYRKYFMMQGIEPNAAHRVLAKMEDNGKMAAVITQNVDSLHQQAGSKKVYELHGNAHDFFCSHCYKKFTYDEVDQMELVPRCDKCGHLIRSTIVNYQESLDPQVMTGAIHEIRKSDLLIVGGTSLSVYPAAGLIHYQKKGGKIALINLGNAQCMRTLDVAIDADIAEVFSELEKILHDREIL